MISNYVISDRVNELNEASEAYYNSGHPIMSDKEFDWKLKELQRWENETGFVLSNSPTQNVGTVILKNIPEVVHDTPMLSLDKCHSVEEIVKFANGKKLVASVKLDGISCRLIYKDGELFRSESRGNGISGNDITKSVKQFKDIPLHINKKGTYVIDGEALIKLDDFAAINTDSEYKNSRNLTAGTLSSLDTSAVKNRRLTWRAWEVVEGEDLSNSFYERLAQAIELGFSVVPHLDVLPEEYNDLDPDIDLLLKTAEEKSLPQDGVVFKFDDVEYGKSLGNTNHHFRNGIAWKAPNNDEITTLKDIEWSMGKTGILTPVAIFEPVELEGTTVNKASLHNLSVVSDILGQPYRGQKIAVYKANLIIPQVRWGDIADKNSGISFIHIPDTCPICGGKTQVVKENDSEQLICTNPDCKGKLLGKLTHAVSRNALNIDGLSESTIEKFISLGWLASIKDIYHLHSYEKVMKTLDGFGKKSVDKLLSSINTSRNTTLSRFLYSLSIPLLGKTASAAISAAVDSDYGTFIHVMTTEGADYFRHLPGVGDSLINSMNTYFKKHIDDVMDLSTELIFELPVSPLKETMNEIDSKKLEGKTFVITGSLNHYSNRDVAKAEILAYGGKVSDSVSAKTSYLVNNDINSSSSKNKKAKSLGIPIITEEELMAMIH